MYTRRFEVIRTVSSTPGALKIAGKAPGHPGSARRAARALLSSAGVRRPRFGGWAYRAGQPRADCLRAYRDDDKQTRAGGPGERASGARVSSFGVDEPRASDSVSQGRSRRAERLRFRSRVYIRAF